MQAKFVDIQHVCHSQSLMKWSVFFEDNKMHWLWPLLLSQGYSKQQNRKSIEAASLIYVELLGEIWCQGQGNPHPAIHMITNQKENKSIFRNVFIKNVLLAPFITPWPTQCSNKCVAKARNTTQCVIAFYQTFIIMLVVKKGKPHLYHSVCWHTYPFLIHTLQFPRKENT